MNGDGTPANTPVIERPSFNFPLTNRFGTGKTPYNSPIVEKPGFTFTPSPLSPHYNGSTTNSSMTSINSKTNSFTSDSTASSIDATSFNLDDKYESSSDSPSSSSSSSMSSSNQLTRLLLNELQAKGVGDDHGQGHGKNGRTKPNLNRTSLNYKGDGFDAFRNLGGMVGAGTPVNTPTTETKDFFSKEGTV